MTDLEALGYIRRELYKHIDKHDVERDYEPTLSKLEHLLKGDEASKTSDPLEYWKGEVLFQMDLQGITASDEKAEEIANDLLNNDYVWQVINDYIDERIGE